MKDIQNLPDSRRINIQKVGVKNITYPLTVLDRKNRTQKTVATVNMYVNLPHHFKGTHMSRFIEILNQCRGEINLKNFHAILSDMKARLQAEEAHMEVDFPYFLWKTGDGTPTCTEYRCAMHGSLSNVEDLTLSVQVPISPPSPYQPAGLLPRSLGHWGVAAISARLRHFIWIEDLIRIIETITSHDLCWPSEASSTAAAAAADALGVEHLTKAIGAQLQSTAAIKWFTVTVKNFSEGCTTFASLEWPEARSPSS